VSISTIQIGDMLLISRVWGGKWGGLSLVPKVPSMLLIAEKKNDQLSAS